MLQLQQQQDKPSFDLIKSNSFVNCRQCNHRTTTENIHHSNTPQQNNNYIWWNRQYRSATPPPNATKLNPAHNVNPLLENDTTCDSPSDIHVHACTSGQTNNKKRKQSGGEYPMECYHVESPLLRQINDDMNLQTKSSPYKVTSTTVTDEAKRFAQSRYPFPPFKLHFKKSKINDKAIIEELLNYSKVNHNFDLELAGFRSSAIRCGDNESNLLIFVKNSLSYSFLYPEIKWPNRLGDEDFTIDRQPVIPPQLALIITNVSYKTNLSEFENDLKNKYEKIIKVTRLKNWNQFDTKFVKVDFSSAKIRDNILNNGVDHC